MMNEWYENNKDRLAFVKSNDGYRYDWNVGDTCEEVFDSDICELAEEQFLDPSNWKFGVIPLSAQGMTYDDRLWNNYNLGAPFKCYTEEHEDEEISKATFKDVVEYLAGILSDFYQADWEGFDVFKFFDYDRFKGDFKTQQMYRTYYFNLDQYKKMIFEYYTEKSVPVINGYEEGTVRNWLEDNWD